MIGLKDTLTLLSKGYSKKDIQELEKLDQDNEATEAEEPEKKEEAPAEDIKKDEPDYKSLYEELLKESTADKKTIETLQKENTRQDMGPDVEKAKEADAADLLNTIRSFM